MSGRSAWLRRPPETFWVQLGCGGSTVTWGAYILVTGGGILDVLPAYDEATMHVPSWAWARAAAAIGLLQVLVGVGGLRWPKLQTWPRRGAGLMIMAFWAVMGSLMMQAGPSPLGAFLVAFAAMNMPVVLLPLLRPAR